MAYKVNPRTRDARNALATAILQQATLLKIKDPPSTYIRSQIPTSKNEGRFQFQQSKMTELEKKSHFNCTDPVVCPESKDTKVLNMYNIFNLQKRHCE